GVSFRDYPNRTPLLSIATARPALLVTLTLPARLEAGHVEFARQLACPRARLRDRGGASLPGPASVAGGAGPVHADRQSTDPVRRVRAGGPGTVARTRGGVGMTATSAAVRFSSDAVPTVESFVRSMTARTSCAVCTRIPRRSRRSMTRTSGSR